jgi:hypothetical protein
MYDLAYVFIDPENEPATSNKVYRGPVQGDNYWDITKTMAGFDCPDILLDGLYDGLSIHQSFSYDLYDNKAAYRDGETTAMENYDVPVPHCTVWTSLSWHNAGVDPCCPYRESGSPWTVGVWDNNCNPSCTGVTIFGFSSSAPGVDHKIIVTPLKDGMDLLDEYWDTHGSNVGAWLCKTPDCNL